MPNEQTQAAPSAAQETPAVEVERGPLVTMSAEQRAEWRKTGDIPTVQKEPPNTEATAPSDKPEQTASEDAVDSAATQTQEQKQEQQRRDKRRPDIEERFKRYTDEIDQLKRQLAEVQTPKPTQADPSPARQEPPQTYQEWRKMFNPTAWQEEYAQANPNAAWEEMNAAMVDHLSDAKDHFRAIENQRAQSAQHLRSMVNEAQGRYENFAEVADNTAGVIAQAGIHPVVLDVIRASEHYPVLVYKLGIDPHALQTFLEMARANPSKAVRHIAGIENGIESEGKSVKADPPPAPPKTKAPEPPSEVGGRSATPPDEVESAVKANDFRRVSQAWSRQISAK